MQSDVPYQYKQNNFIGYASYDDSVSTKRPAILIFHDWSGKNNFAKQKADWLASLGYVGFAADMYGDGKIGTSTEEKSALMQPLMNNREDLQAKTLQALEALKAIPTVDTAKIAAIGFCFGGLCALDLARSGANIKGVVSFHGLLHKPALATKKITAKVLALHGYQDPMVTPEDLNAFSQEMEASQADWQTHVFGNTKHAFTNPEANNAQMGLMYSPIAEKRSLNLLQQFLTEIFA